MKATSSDSGTRDEGAGLQSSEPSTTGRKTSETPEESEICKEERDEKQNKESEVTEDDNERKGTTIRD
jgi:hypothetical protein